MARFICFIVLISIIFQNVIAIHNGRYGFEPERLHVDQSKNSDSRSPQIIEPEALDAFRHIGRSKRSLKETDANTPQPAKNDSSQSFSKPLTDKSSTAKSNAPADASKNNQTQLVHNNITTMVSGIYYLYRIFM